MEENKNGWKSITVTLNGKELKEIKSVEYTPKFTLEELQNKLQEAEQHEAYLVCAAIKKQIDNYKE